MPTRGLRGRGFSIDNLMLGGGTSDVTINAATCINSVAGYANAFSTPQDYIVRNLVINNQFLPISKTSIDGLYHLYKIQANGKVTLGTSGAIRVDGLIPAGGEGWINDVGCVGYMGSFQYNSGVYVSTCGGSGGGGSSSTSGNGNGGLANGSIPNAPLTYFGGSGGAGASLGGHVGGAGGFSIADSITVPGPSVINFFAPSVYQEGIIYSNLDGNTGGYPANGYFLKPYRINGGGGGGGSGGAISGVGGGAAGGGMCHITCDTLALNSPGVKITADGGSSSGGGGGGGCVIIVTSEIRWNDAGATITVKGGQGINNDSTTNGKPGRVLIFSNNLVASFDSSTVSSFDGVVTKAMYDAAVLAYNS